MSELGIYLKDTVTRFFSEQVDRDFLFSQEAAGWQQGLWDQVVELGFDTVLMTEEQGGVGGDWDDAYLIIQSLGRYAVPLPLGETIIARWLLSQAGAEIPAGPGSLSFGKSFDRIPWGRDVGWAVGQLQGESTLSLLHVLESNAGSNLAREPRDSWKVEQAQITPLSIEFPEDIVLYLGALLRSAQIAGAAYALVEKASQYADERSQFGRPLSKFQAVQHNLAQLVTAAASVDAVTRAAYHQMNNLTFGDDVSDDVRLTIAAAKYRASESADLLCRLAHQIHGAIGFTYEHDLHFFTRRLWSWRSEFGSAGFWAEQLGEQAIRHGGEGIWGKITAAGAAVDQ